MIPSPDPEPVGARRPVGAGAWTIVSALVVATTVMAGALGAGPQDPHTAAAVFPPWWSQAAALTAASRAGAVTGVGALPFIIVVLAPDGDADRRARQAGALFSLDPSRIGCGTQSV